MSRGPMPKGFTLAGRSSKQKAYTARYKAKTASVERAKQHAKALAVPATSWWIELATLTKEERQAHEARMRLSPSGMPQEPVN